MHIFFMICCTTGIINAQDLHFSSIHTLNQQLFPEFAGLNNDVEASIFYREQWKSIGSKFGAYGASVASTLQPKHKLDGSHLSGGLNFYSEKMNKDASLTAGKMTIVRHQSISRFSKISLGLNVGFQTLSFDPANGSWGSQHNGFFYDENLSSGETFITNRKTGLDIGTGLIYSLNHKRIALPKFQFGFSAQHVNRPNMSFYNDRSGYLPIKTVFYGMLNLKLGNSGSYFQTSLLIQKQKLFSSIVLGSILKIKLNEKAKTTSSFGTTDKTLLGIGAYYRSADAFIACVMLQKTAWNISLAYDFTLSNMKNYNYSRGGIELQLQYTISSLQVVSRF